MKTVCATQGVSDVTAYTLRRKHAAMENDHVKRPRMLERENESLKLLVAERELEISAVRKLWAKNGWALSSGCGSAAPDV
ncbi:MAG: hypothetical protein KGJ62_15460 [Armatimonadetes bacterium]|nr:hypothetical protein [Armatimonadota bacterium]MDE2207479.1 hypothetical protein [Armatimonadota bacterium]